MKFISMCFLVLILVGCSEPGMSGNIVNEQLTVNSKTEVYTVHSMDLLFRYVLENGNGDRIYLHLSELDKDQIREGSRVEITDYEYKQGNRSWLETQYRLLD